MRRGARGGHPRLLMLQGAAAMGPVRCSCRLPCPHGARHLFVREMEEKQAKAADDWGPRGRETRRCG
jgi:hypothetical protein